MLKIRIICIGLCITEDKVVQNAHIDFNIKEEHINQINNSQEHIQEEKQTAKTDEIKENKPDEIKQDVIEQKKPKYSFVQKVIFIIFFLVCIMVLLVFVVHKIKKMREKSLLVDCLKKEEKYKKDSIGEQIFEKNFYEIAFNEKKLGDFSFCKQDKENFLVIIKDKSENYFVYIFYPAQQKMIIINSENYHKYNYGNFSSRSFTQEEIFIANFFLKKQQNVFQDIVGKVLTVQNFLLQKTKVFLVRKKNPQEEDIQHLQRRLNGEIEIREKWDFPFPFFLHDFLGFLSKQNLPENSDYFKENYLFLFSENSLSLVSKKEIQINEQILLSLEKYGENNIFFFIETITVTDVSNISNDFKFFVCFFKGEKIILPLQGQEINSILSSKIKKEDKEKILDLFKKVKEKKDLLEIQQKEKIENFLKKNKLLFDAALEKCKNGASEAKIMSMNYFLEIFLTDKDVKK